MVQDVGQVGAQFIDGLYSQFLSQTVSCIDSVDGEVINQSHLAGLLSRETFRSTFKFAVLRWIKPPMFDFLLRFVPDKLIVFSISC